MIRLHRISALRQAAQFSRISVLPRKHTLPRTPALPRAAALAGALALTAALGLAGAPPAAADPNPNVDVSTLANPTLDDALLNILTAQGINYEPVTDVQSAANASGPDTTLVIDNDESLTMADVSELQNRQFGRIVILTNDSWTLGLFPVSGISTYQTTGEDNMAPGCNQPNAAADSAGEIDDPGLVMTYYDVSGQPVGQSCYLVDGKPSLVEVPANAAAGTPDTVLLGSTAFLENQYLADDGNADLAMRIFGQHTNLVWLATSFTDDSALDCGNSQCVGSSGGNGSNGGGGNGSNGGNGTTTTVSPGPNGNSANPPTLESLLPNWIWWVLAQILVAILLIAYWQARRHGRIVAEPLPVTVRAAETVEGHARLYRKAGAYSHSAHLLRQAVAGRLAPVFGLPQSRAEADPGILVQPIAALLTVDPTLVGELLVGEVPASEAELVLLADHLDLLEQEVRSS